MFFALGVKTLLVPESVGSYFREEKWFSKNTFGEESVCLGVPSAKLIKNFEACRRFVNVQVDWLDAWLRMLDGVATEPKAMYEDEGQQRNVMAQRK